MRRVSNPPSPYTPTHVEWADGQAPLAGLKIHEERARSIVSENGSPDLPFRYSVNPYRGCQHACAYCYARPSHQYWGLGAGTDFDRQIIVKVNAPQLLSELFCSGRWRGAPITFSGNTDCYQPLEGRYRLTRALLEICARHRNPVTIITKSALVLRDLPVLQELAASTRLRVFMSIPFAEDPLGRALEPGAAAVSRRFATLQALSEAGIETGVSVAPLIPGLSESHMVAVLRAARAAGARYAFTVLLRLPAEVAPVFLGRVQEVLPLKAAAVESGLRQMRSGKLNTSEFGHRMRGQGSRFELLADLFALQCRRLGLVTREPEADAVGTFRREVRQMELFPASAPCARR